jgi:DNA recombination protein RmuC
MFLYILIVLQLAISVALLLVLLLRDKTPLNDFIRQQTEMRIVIDKVEPSVRGEVRAFRTEVNERATSDRKEAAEGSHSLRKELISTVTDFGEQINTAIGESRREQAQASDQLRESVQNTLVSLGGELRESNNELTANVRDRLGDVALEITQLTGSSNQKLEAIQLNVTKQLEELKDKQVHTGETLSQSIQANFSRLSVDLRETSRQLNDNVQQRLGDVGRKVAELSEASEKSQESLRTTVEDKLNKLNESNSQKLEEVRVTVDEKLHSTLEKRLTDSFGMVSDQLGSVQRGLGEMKDLATGVGDLKRVLTNIKSRGGYGEVQLEMLLEQLLSPEQYVKNAKIRPETQESVEFAIKFPEDVLLPIDAKFPHEAWERLEDAQARGDLQDVRDAGEKLEAAIRTAAKDISGKYIEPPLTTNFAVMFLPTEGLFAETVRRPGLMDELRSKHRIVVAGPTTFASLLMSLQMGFRTLAIQKKGSEVWKILAATKQEFERFSGLMDKVDKNIVTVQNTLREVGTRTRVITRKLKEVETAEVEIKEPATLLGAVDNSEDGETVEVESADTSPESTA